MAGITLAEAQAQLDTWMEANTKVAANQGYTIGDRELRRADAAEILQQIKFWDAKVKELSRSSGGGMRIRGITPA